MPDDEALEEQQPEEEPAPGRLGPFRTWFWALPAALVAGWAVRKLVLTGAEEACQFRDSVSPSIACFRSGAQRKVTAIYLFVFAAAALVAALITRRAGSRARGCWIVAAIAFVALLLLQALIEVPVIELPGRV